MTICCAIPIVNLKSNPHIRFTQPGVIIAAESRISFSNGNPPDDKGMKVGELTDFAIAGFAGNVGIAYSALNSLVGERVRKPGKIAPRAKELLKRFYAKEKSKGISLQYLQTDVLIAVRYNDGQIKLYHLSSSDRFIPKAIRSAVAIGDGAKEFTNSFNEEYEAMGTAWQRRALGRRAFQKGTNKFREDLDSIPTSTTDRPNVSWNEVSITVMAAISEVLDKTTSTTIGGKVQTLALTHDGVQRINLFKSVDQGKTWEKASLD